MSDQLEFTFEPTPVCYHISDEAQEGYINSSMNIILRDLREDGRLIHRQNPERLRCAASIIMDNILWSKTPEGVEGCPFWHEVYERLKCLADAADRARARASVENFVENLPRGV